MRNQVIAQVTGRRRAGDLREPGESVHDQCFLAGPATIDRRFAHSGARSHGFHREAFDAVIGEQRKSGIQNGFFGPFAAWATGRTTHGRARSRHPAHTATSAKSSSTGSSTTSGRAGMNRKMTSAETTAAHAEVNDAQ